MKKFFQRKRSKEKIMHQLTMRREEWFITPRFPASVHRFNLWDNAFKVLSTVLAAVSTQQFMVIILTLDLS